MLLKNVPFERWMQLMIVSFKTVNLAWVCKIAVIGHALFFVYQRAHSFEG